jgi:hypothetical protein
MRLLGYSAGIAWRFSRPARQQSRRFVAAAWLLFSFGTLGFDVWATVRNPHSWESYPLTALGITTVVFLIINWRTRYRRAR